MSRPLICSGQWSQTTTGITQPAVRLIANSIVVAFCLQRVVHARYNKTQGALLMARAVTVSDSFVRKAKSPLVFKRALHWILTGPG